MVSTTGAPERRVAPDASARRHRVTERPPLPADVAGLPPLGPDFDATLDAGLAELGLQPTPAQRSALDAHARLLLAWNADVNLTALRTPEQVARAHIVDSLTGVRHLSRRQGISGDRLDEAALLDLGSGGGYPGLPLAAWLPGRRVALVDSVRKKARFLEVASAAVVEALAATGEERPRIEVLAKRAEDLAHDPAHREAWSVVTARAVGSLTELAELGLPLLRAGGRLVAWKRDDGAGSLAEEIRDASPVIHAAGGDPPTVEDVRVEGLPGHRLVVVTKRRPTPNRFPRTPAERRRALLT